MRITRFDKRNCPHYDKACTNVTSIEENVPFRWEVRPEVADGQHRVVGRLGDKLHPRECDLLILVGRPRNQRLHQRSARVKQIGHSAPAEK